MIIRKKVSVIIPTYNRRERLERAVESVLAQSYPEFELIVADDGSEDSTADLISRYGSRVIYLPGENRGVAAARNRGIAAARGELIAFLDSDDRWERDKLQAQLQAMEENPSYLISHTEEIWYRRGRRLNPRKIHRKSGGSLFARSLTLCVVSISTAVARREFFEKIGVFDESLPCCEDYDLWLRAAARFPFLLVDRPLTLKEGGRPDQLSSIYRVGMDRYRIQSLLKILTEADLLSPEQRRLALAELERKCRIYGEGCRKHGRAEEADYYLSLPRAILQPRDNHAGFPLPAPPPGRIADRYADDRENNGTSEVDSRRRQNTP